MTTGGVYVWKFWNDIEFKLQRSVETPFGYANIGMYAVNTKNQTPDDITYRLLLIQQNHKILANPKEKQWNSF